MSKLSSTKLLLVSLAMYPQTAPATILRKGGNELRQLQNTTSAPTPIPTLSPSLAPVPTFVPVDPDSEDMPIDDSGKESKAGNQGLQKRSKKGHNVKSKQGVSPPRGGFDDDGPHTTPACCCFVEKADSDPTYVLRFARFFKI